MCMLLAGRCGVLPQSKPLMCSSVDQFSKLTLGTVLMAEYVCDVVSCSNNMTNRKLW